MTARTGVRRRLLLLPLVVLLFAGVANAASIGPVTSARLSGFAGTGPSGAKTVYASDNFTGANNTLLNGRALVMGQTWFVPGGGGDWRVNATNEADVPNVNDGRIVTATGQANVRIIVTVTDGGAGGRTSGVVLHSNATASRYLSVHWQNGSGGRIILTRHDGGATTLATGNVGAVSPVVWSVVLNGASIVVSYNGNVELTYTLTGTDLTTFGPLTSHGMFNDNAGLVRYDNFRVESL